VKVIDDGVIKYDRTKISSSGPLELSEYQELEYWRKKLYQLNLIGEYSENNIGFGNLSAQKIYSHFFKTTKPQFVITGTQTGKYADLDASQYTRVLDYNIEQLLIKVMGPIEASSEALTHAAVYNTSPRIKYVFHIHSEKIWNALIENKADFTSKDIAYGTAEMAKATAECIGAKTSGFFCMHGHADGVVIYGEKIEEVASMTLELYEKYH
jgi:hypothetical protein